jgi:hypothetical protein
LRRYNLEVKAQFAEESLKNEEQQLVKDIVQSLSRYRSGSHEEEVIGPRRLSSPVFHRLYTNLVDKDDTLQERVNELGMKYRLHGAQFKLTPQDP